MSVDKNTGENKKDEEREGLLSDTRERDTKKRGGKKRFIIAKLDDFISLEDVCSKCGGLRKLLEEQRKGELSYEMWQKAVILLVGSGYVAHARKFTRLSQKTNIPENYGFIDDISMSREENEIIHCRDLGCAIGNIKKCFKYHEDEDYEYSPSFGILAMTDDEKEKLGFVFNETKSKKDDAAKNKNDSKRKSYRRNDDG
jgi:hypothetical protein